MRALIGMDFASFLILLVISAVVSAILHYGLKYYILPGTASYLAKVVIGWFGAWLGSPILGYWWEGVNHEHVYCVPAILGAVGILVLAIDGLRTIARAWGSPSSSS